MAGGGLYEIIGTTVLVKPNGSGWSVQITAMAADDSGNSDGPGQEAFGRLLRRNKSGDEEAHSLVPWLALFRNGLADGQRTRISLPTGGVDKDDDVVISRVLVHAPMPKRKLIGGNIGQPGHGLTLEPVNAGAGQG